MDLTPAQQAVVAHDHGPALVFAVAGAGKTTAMVHRIERLVRKGIFAPGEILATSFGKGNELDIRTSLARWPHTRGVRVHTLHALGRGLIVLAQRHGNLRRLKLDHGEGSSSAHLVLNRTLGAAWRHDVPYKPELDGLDRQDFLSYVAASKGNLRYADLESVQLPPDAQQVARQADAPPAPLSWYLDLYRLFEEVRQEMGVITFPDMLLTGWEVLVRFPEVRTAAQERARCVLVDEFQDINLAQSEILDLITAPTSERPHRNYMAIGDDDQTIYEWRGASPHYILQFEERYGARRYFIQENFRSPAGPLLLANNVIAHNRQRAPKRLRLTRGFSGETALHTHQDEAAMAGHIVSQIQAFHQQGRTWREMAILVRLNAQTPPIEQALIEAEIPYLVSRPFYERPEIKTLIHYVRLAWVERTLQTGDTLNTRQQQWFSEAWQDVYNRPKRYISRELRDRVERLVRSDGVPPSEALRFIAPHVPYDSVAEEVEKLADDVRWLAQNLAGDAHNIVRVFEMNLQYRQFLREHSGFPQTGEGYAASVAAFIEYARNKGNVLEFMNHVRDLARKKIGYQERANNETIQRAEIDPGYVTVSTIHGAKGLEWPYVFVAQINQGIIPFEGKAGEAIENATARLEEERRLFYVALTRSRHTLSLHTIEGAGTTFLGQRPSQFLGEARAAQILPAVTALQTLLARDPTSWSAQEALTLGQAVARYRLAGYFRHWWQDSSERLQAVAATMSAFFAAVEATGGWQRLDLKPEAGDVWQELAPAGTPAREFPELDQLLNRAEKAKPDPTAGEPACVRPGMWIRSDAGWGRIEQIEDETGQPLAELNPREPSGYCLHVTLRPEHDALHLEVDLGQERISFFGVKHVYTCTKCNAFSAADPHLIDGGHDEIAHGGIGARFRKERGWTRRLRTIYYSGYRPAEPLE